MVALRGALRYAEGERTASASSTVLELEAQPKVIVPSTSVVSAIVGRVSEFVAAASEKLSMEHCERAAAARARSSPEWSSR